MQKSVLNARLNAEGFRNMLALRTEIEGGNLAADRYVDLGYYERALKLLSQ